MWIQVEREAIFSWRLAAGGLERLPSAQHDTISECIPAACRRAHSRARTTPSTRAQTRIRGDIFPNICSACTYIRRRLIESKGRGRYKVCRPPRHKTHALPGSTLPNERTSRSCSNVHLVSVDTPTLPSVPKKLGIERGGEGRGDATKRRQPTMSKASVYVCVRGGW